MSQADQRNNPDLLSNIPVKRKRGRPRKYPRQIEENAHMPNNQNLNLGQNAGIGIPPPPGFERRNGNQPHQAAPINVPTDGLVGTPVFGVVEGTFNGGYLVRIRVGNSETTLTGLVLKRGSYIPVSGLKDMAPNVQMIERTGKQVPSVASKGKQAPPVAPKTVDPVFTRGNLSPVILQPRSLSNRVLVTSESTSVATQAAHLATSKSKAVPSVAPPSNGSTTSTNQASTVGNHAFASQLESIHPVMSDFAQNENGSCSFNQPSTEVLLETEAKSMRLPDMPFEKLVTEVVKRIHAPSQSVKTHIEPLDDKQCKDHSTPASKPPEDGTNGKMSELLQVLQESMMEGEGGAPR